jgi:hypothetical protein
MTKLENWQHHIQHTHLELDHTSWCGEKLVPGFHYLNIDHAAYSMRNGDRIQPCPACVEAVVGCLTGGDDKRS